MPPLGPHPLAPPAPAPHGPTDVIAHAVTANPFAFKTPAPFAAAQRQAAQQTRQAANRAPSQPQLQRTLHDVVNRGAQMGMSPSQTLAWSQGRQAKPGDLSPRINAAGFTINLGPALDTIGRHLAGNPLAAFGSGFAKIASQQPVS